MVSQLIEEAKSGRRRAIAKLITQVENDPIAAREIISGLYLDTGKAHVVGVTGPPGSGKSTLVNEIAKELRKSEQLVGIVAVDPSSPFTGGALLGDRVRMRDLSGDRGIFIRSMASRGSLGGLAHSTGNVVKILDAAGFHVILVETVGAGQAEVDIANAAHTTLVIEAPGMGDEIQTIKAGILEIADLLVVNKMDRPGSDRAVKALRMMLHMGTTRRDFSHHGQAMMISAPEQVISRDEKAWEVPLLETVATEGLGITQVTDAIAAHREHLIGSGSWVEREKSRSRREISQLLQDRFMSKMQLAVPFDERDTIIDAVARRQMDPYSAVDRLFLQTQTSDSVP